MIEADMAAWDRNPKGEIQTEPVVAWAVAAMPLNVAVRLEILQEDGRIAWAQLHLPATEAADLAKALRLKAKRALSAPTQGRA